MAILLTTAGATATWATPQKFTLEGTLLEKGTRKPLEGVNVFCLPEGQSPLKGVTDSMGNFRIEEVPEGPIQWKVNLSGYERLEQKENPAARAPHEFFLERSTYLAYETTIVDQAQKRDDKTRAITRDQISQLAGAGNDPIKAVQNLPGVNRTSGFSAQVIIEGSSPMDTDFQIEGQEVPIIFHFGGLTTVVPPEAVERVDLNTAGFGAENGLTTAGGITVWLKKPATDRLHGLAFIDLFNIGGIIEGPVTPHSSFFFSARQSYVGAVLKAAFKNNSDFNLTVAPDFSDFTGIFQAELTPLDDFRLLTLGSLDTLSFVLSEPVKSDPTLRGNFSNRTAFFRVIPEWTHRHSATTTSRLSLGIGKDWLTIDTGNNFFHLQEWALSTRGELEQNLTSHWRSIIGFDNAYYFANVGFLFPKLYNVGGVSNPISVATPVSATLDDSIRDIAIYWRNEIKIADTPWTLIPALRAQYQSETGEFIPLPRFQARYKVNEAWTLRTAEGFYSMDPQPQETSPVYGNPGLKAPTALHASLGAETDLRGGSTRGWNLSGDLFYKHFFRKVVPSTALVTQSDGTLAPENFTNNGSARSFGLEMQARYDFAPWSGWINYTLSRSSAWDNATPESVSAYDQTHNLAAVASRELGRHWQLSARLRLVTGNPYTPVVGGTFDADNDVYIPTRGAYFSQRMTPFWQLDLRVDKKWIYDQWILSAYLDIQNATNHANAEMLQYSYNYQQSASVNGLPLIPILGVKGEF